MCKVYSKGINNTLIRSYFIIVTSKERRWRYFVASSIVAIVDQLIVGPKAVGVITSSEFVSQGTTHHCTLQEFLVDETSLMLKCRSQRSGLPTLVPSKRSKSFCPMLMSMSNSSAGCEEQQYLADPDIPEQSTFQQGLDNSQPSEKDVERMSFIQWILTLLGYSPTKPSVHPPPEPIDQSKCTPCSK
ncbi:hypothetical protein J6590_055449 [Homalodisca vitripennis]|nr:hypothetical protein J6590_055449 [Homalodisca vitripennis]